MTDLIRRADAIEAVCRDCSTQDKIWCKRTRGCCDDVRRIKALPSADITETEECQKCQETTERVLNRQGDEIKRLKASAEAVQGEWKRIEINGYQYAVCDQCNLLADMVEKDGKLVMSMANADYEYANFCPNCGAKMKGGDSE